MPAQPIFTRYPLFDRSWEDFAAGVLLAILVLLTLRLRAEKKTRHPDTYSPRLAWLRGFIYFAASFLVSWGTGVFKTITRTPLIASSQYQSPAWWGMTGLAFLVVAVGYLGVWPRGTKTMGRPLHTRSVLAFGLLWGLAEGQLYLSFWATAERTGLPLAGVVVAGFVAISIFKGFWHRKYWDVHVAPEHNIIAGNGRKVLFAHVPNLVFSLAHLALYGNAVLFVLLQTFALVASTYFMRFPSIRDPDLEGALHPLFTPPRGPALHRGQDHE